MGKTIKDFEEKLKNLQEEFVAFKNARRKVRKWSSAVKKGKMSKQKFDEKYLAWKNHASHGNCIKLCRSMYKCIDELLGD